MTKKLILAICMLLAPSLVMAESFYEQAMTRTFFTGDYSKKNMFYYELASTAASTTSSLTPCAITGTYMGYLTNVRVSSHSQDFDISILTRDDANAIDTIDEIYSATAINKDYSDAIDPPEPFINNNYTNTTFNPKNYPVLYVRIKNDDAVNATGVIRLQLIFNSK